VYLGQQVHGSHFTCANAQVFQQGRQGGVIGFGVWSDEDKAGGALPGGVLYLGHEFAASVSADYFRAEGKIVIEARSESRKADGIPACE